MTLSYEVFDDTADVTTSQTSMWLIELMVEGSSGSLNPCRLTSPGIRLYWNRRAPVRQIHGANRATCPTSCLATKDRRRGNWGHIRELFGQVAARSSRNRLSHSAIGRKKSIARAKALQYESRQCNYRNYLPNKTSKE